MPHGGMVLEPANAALQKRIGLVVPLHGHQRLGRGQQVLRAFRLEVGGTHVVFVCEFVLGPALVDDAQEVPGLAQLVVPLDGRLERHASLVQPAHLHQDASVQQVVFGRLGVPLGRFRDDRERLLELAHLEGLLGLSVGDLRVDLVDAVVGVLWLETGLGGTVAAGGDQWRSPAGNGDGAVRGHRGLLSRSGSGDGRGLRSNPRPGSDSNRGVR